MKKVRFCPKCGSKDVERDVSVQSYGGGTIFNQFKCNKCGYEGQFFPECYEDDYKMIKKEMVKK